MRIGFCTNANFAFGEEDSVKRLEAIAKSGFDYVETQIAPLTKLSENEFSALVRRLEDMNLPCRASLMLFPPDTALVGGDVDYAFLADSAEKAIDRAARMGSETIVFGHGGTRSYKNGVTKTAAYQSIVKILKTVDVIAVKNGVKVAIEPLNSSETNMVVNYREAIEMAIDVGGGATGCLCDWYHAWMEKQSPDEMDIMPEKLYHLHIAYPEGRKVPSADDEPEIYRPFFEKIRKLGYNDKISIEAGIPMLRDYYTLFSEGLAAVKKLIKYFGLQ